MKKICLALSVVLCMTFSLSGFVTYGAKDKKAPKVVSSNPKNKQKNVAVNKKITVKFSEKIVKGAKFKKIKLLKGKKAVAAKVKISGKTLKVTPKSKLAKGTKYTLQIPAKAVKDKAKNNLKKVHKVTFTTVKAIDETPTPQVVPTVTPVPTVTTAPTAIPTVTPSPTPFVMPVWDFEGEPGVKFIGRFDMSRAPYEYTTTWPGAIIDAWFEGTDVSAKLKTAGTSYVQVIIDGVDHGIVVVAFGDNVYSLATGLEEGIHNIQLIKRNEGWSNLTFKGFQFTDGRLLAPEPERDRKIEFIGDSITCGHGIDSNDKDEGGTDANGNAYLSYASITARNLHADLHTTSASGIGVFNKSANLTITELYDDTVLTFDNSAKAWDFTTWQPGVVVINIATNDMKSAHADGGALPSKEKFGNAYLELLQLVRTNNPNAHIICFVGPMLAGDGLARAVEGTKYAIEKFGDSKTSYFEVPTQLPSDGYGASYHPSKTTHEKMATALTAEIQRITGWY